jgi:hypothetical protein
MKKMIPVILVYALLILGCATPKPRLAYADVDSILATAQRELRDKCPEFRFNDFEPISVEYRVHTRTKWPISKGPDIAVRYQAKRPCRVEERASPTNGPARYICTYETAFVLLTPEGKLVLQDVSEWRDFPESNFIAYSAFLIYEPKNQGVQMPVGNGYWAQEDMRGLSIACQNYQFAFGTFPTGSCASICQALGGANPRHVVCFDFQTNRVQNDGYYCDPWGTPYRIDFTILTNVSISSAGIDKKWDTEDDLSYK